MTIVCAIYRNGETWIGADTRAVRSNEKSPAMAKKWLFFDEAAIGCTASWALVQAVADRLDEISSDWTPQKIFSWTRTVILDFGVEPEKKPGEPPWVDFSMIFVRPGEIWDISPVGGPLDYAGCGKLCTRGTGDEYALGAAFAYLRLYPKASPEKIMVTAIDAAKAYDTSCGGETWVHRFS